MSKAKMQAAKELIQEKRYREARQILETVDHPTATKWLARLDELAPQETGTIRRSVNRSTFIGAGVLVVAVVAAGILIAAALSRPAAQPASEPVATLAPNPTATTAALEAALVAPEATLTVASAQIRSILSAPLEVYCQSLEERTKGGCSRWADAVLAEHLDEALACYQEYDSIFDKGKFSTCLLFFGISPIGDDIFIDPITVDEMKQPDYVDSIVTLELYCESGSRNEDWCHVWAAVSYKPLHTILPQCADLSVLSVGGQACLRQHGIAVP